MSFPVLCAWFGPETGWACQVPGMITSGTLDCRGPAGLACTAGGWLGEVRRQQPRFSALGIADCEVDQRVPLIYAVSEWADSVGAEVRFIPPARIKRVASGPYATRRDVLEWALKRFAGHRIISFAQAAALASLISLEALPER